MKKTAFLTAAIIVLAISTAALAVDGPRAQRRGSGRGWHHRPYGQCSTPPADCPLGFGHRQDRRERPAFRGQDGMGGPRQGAMGRQGFGRRGPASDRMAPGRGGPLAQLRFQLRNLDLTDEQAGQIKKVFEDKREPLREAHQAVRQAQREVRETAMSGGGEEAIRTAAEELADTVAHEAVLIAEIRGSIRDVLTDEQKERLETLRDEAIERREKTRQRIR